MFSVRIQASPIADAAAGGGPAASGAVVRFVGKVRDDPHDGVALSHLVLEHFPGVTEAEIERIVGLARQRWAIQAARVVHRVGSIPAGQDIVLVETASAHRRDAYEANAFIMDYLKTEAPFWKQECYADGSQRWVEARSSDQLAQQRWNAPPARALRIGALVLAGGEGRRMGGRNKGLEPLRGRPLVQHVIDALRPQVSCLVISANRDLPAYEALDAPVCADMPALAGLGPLAGILSAAPRLPQDLDAILIAPCDTPRLPADLVSRLAGALFSPAAPPAVMAATPGGPQACVLMLRPAALVTLVPRILDPSDLSLRGWLRDCGCATVAFDDEAAFANVNDPAALHGLETGAPGS